MDIKDDYGRTPLGLACRWYIEFGALECFTVIDALLAGRQGAAGTRNALEESLNAPTGRGLSVAGAQPELDEYWKILNWTKPDQRTRCDWLAAYVDTWGERRARDRAADESPAFDYSL